MTDLDQLRVSWTALSAAPGPSGHGVATLALDDQLPTGRAVVARDLDGRRHLLVPRAQAEPVMEDRESGAVQILALSLGEGAAATEFVDVVCRDPKLADVFDDLILAILRELVRDGTQPNAACLRVLEEWRQMLRPPPREPLSVNQTAGLVAELMVASAILVRDPAHRIDVWTGPSPGRHDFRRGRLAIEVKATLSTGEPTPEIHGIEQLEAPPDGELYLVWMRLERVPGGQLTVAGLVEDLRRLVGGGPPVYERLMESGWRPESASEAIQFELRERRVHAVRDAFPRLVPRMIAGGVPPGLVNVRYSINLDAAGTPPLTDTETDILFQTIATTPTQ
jgi:hypothetical protein